MKIQDLKNLDLYKCSLQDINTAYSVIGEYLQLLIDNGHINTATREAKDVKWNEGKKLHVLISRARHGMDADGFMIGYNTNIDRLPNNKSIL
tara:strand:+ start:1582 stop:1857 length:276 start_codon:yes stop_codon:yes gene_type:complete